MATIDEPVTSVHRPPVTLPTTQASLSQNYVGAAAEPAILSKRSASPTLQRRSPELAQRPPMSLAATTRASPRPLSPKPVTARFSPRPLTAAEALAAERRSRASVASNRSDNGDGRGRSPNPAANAIEALLGSHRT